MKKIFLSAGILFLFLSGGVFAHVGEEGATTENESVVKMDMMMSETMMGHKDFNCAEADSHFLMDAGEEFMEKMLGGDKEKHKKIETVMETEAGAEFHDTLHLAMGRMASGCFSDEEQNLMAPKLGVATSQDRSVQLAIFIAGLVGGAILGLVFASFLRKSV